MQIIVIIFFVIILFIFLLLSLSSDEDDEDQKKNCRERRRITSKEDIKSLFKWKWFVIEVKNFSGKLVGNEDDQYWNKYKISRGN